VLLKDKQKGKSNPLMDCSFYIVAFLVIPVKACRQSHIVINAYELPPNRNAKEGSRYMISVKEARHTRINKVCKG
jgi:hypothetical protein